MGLGPTLIVRTSGDVNIVCEKHEHEHERKVIGANSPIELFLVGTFIEFA